MPIIKIQNFSRHSESSLISLLSQPSLTVMPTLILDNQFSLSFLLSFTCSRTWYRWKHLIYIIHSPVSRYLGYFLFFATVNKSTMTIIVQTFLCTYVAISFGQISRSGNYCVKGRCMFNFLRSCKIILFYISIVIYEISITLHPHQHSVLEVFLILVILMVMYSISLCF